MKLTKIFNLFILLVISCLLVGCAKQKDTEGEEVNVPTTTEEIMDVISKVPGIIYEVDQDTSYLPDGATYSLFATLHNECLVVIHYNSNDNCDKGYDKSKELIKEALQKEVLEYADENAIVKKAECIIYGGTKKMIDYFEGKIDKEEVLPNIPSSIKEFSKHYEDHGYFTHGGDIESNEDLDKGIKGIMYGAKVDGDIANLIMIYIIDSTDNVAKYKEDIIDMGMDSLRDELDGTGYEVNKFRFGSIGNVIYVGTPDAVVIITK